MIGRAVVRRAVSIRREVVKRTVIDEVASIAASKFASWKQLWRL